MAPLKVNVFNSCRLDMFQTRTWLSLPPDTKVLPSADKAKQLTELGLL